MARRPIDAQELALEKRDLARRARRLANTQIELADQARLTQYADELEKEASALERAPAASPPVTHQQQQQQQQEATDPPTDPEKPKD